MCFVLRESDYVHEAVINIETTPIQVNIILSNSKVLPPEVKEYIEKMIIDVFQDAVIEYTEPSPEETVT